MSDKFSKELIHTLDIVPSCLMVISPQKLIIGINHYFKESLGIDSESFVGKRLDDGILMITERWKFGDNGYFLEIDRWFTDNGGSLENELTKDAFSTKFHGVSYNTIIENSNTSSIIINFGIKSHLLKALSLSHLDVALQDMIDDTEVLISIVDAYGNIEYRNPAWEEFVGESIPITGRFRWEDSLHPEDLEHFQEILYDAIAHRRAFAAEFRMKDFKWEYRWLKIRGTPRINNFERFLGYICTAIEISESKRQMAELERLNLALRQSHDEVISSKEELQAAFDAAEMGSCSLEISTLKAEMSIRYRELYGLPLHGEINWEMVTEAVEPEYRVQVNQVLENAAKYGHPVDSTYPIRHLQSKERRWMRVVGKVRRDENEIPQSVYAVVMDVSKQMEEERNKSEFIAMVSHELKTPITSISGFTQLLLHKAGSGIAMDVEPVCRKIQRQLKKMNRMIEGFLNISRLEGNKMEIQKNNFDFSALIDDCHEQFINEISTHDVVFNKNGPAIIHADRDKIEMVVHNMINNALKYSPVGSKVEINYLCQGNELYVSVSDQGMGIIDEEKEKLFKRYFRSQQQHIFTVAGFGIGLFICAQIIGLHQGAIWAENVVNGSGARFTFKIPISQQ